MIAKEYLETFPTPCGFHDWKLENGVVTENKPCGEPAVAVYVTADHLHIGRYVCEKHAKDAERGADGPVFWQKK